MFLDFLSFLLFEENLAFLSVFPFFSRDFGGSEEMENPCFFGGFLAFSRKSKEKKIRGKFILARTHEKTIPPCTKEPLSLEIFIPGLKFSFSLENSIPGLVFFCGQRGAHIEKTILD